MRIVIVLLLSLQFHDIWAYVYSCEEIKYKLAQSEFTADSKHLCVIAEHAMYGESPAKTDALRGIYAKHGMESTSFALIANLTTNCISKEDGKWTIAAKSVETINCTQQFTLILTDIELTISRPAYYKGLLSHDRNSIVVSPRSGISLERHHDCSGPGNITLFTGAGNGEREERFRIRSWTCETLPTKIYSFDNVLTIHFDEGIDTWFMQSADPSLHTTVNHPGERIVVFSSGRSNNLANRIEGGHKLDFNIANLTTLEVKVKAQLSFEPSNICSKVSLRERTGQSSSFYNGTFAESFVSNYFEVLYEPQIAQGDVWRSQDSFFMDIKIGTIDWTDKPVPPRTSTTAPYRLEKQCRTAYTVDRSTSTSPPPTRTTSSETVTEEATTLGYVNTEPAGSSIEFTLSLPKAIILLILFFAAAVIGIVLMQRWMRRRELAAYTRPPMVMADLIQNE